MSSFRVGCTHTITSHSSAARLLSVVRRKPHTVGTEIPLGWASGAPGFPSPYWTAIWEGWCKGKEERVGSSEKGGYLHARLPNLSKPPLLLGVLVRSDSMSNQKRASMP